jgi:hypothetical protein
MQRTFLFTPQESQSIAQTQANQHGQGDIPLA